jgi:glycine cleavage system H protein
VNVPKELHYTKEHEWVRVRGQEAEVGVTDYAQGELGDVVFVELPALGTRVSQMKPFGTIDAVKTVSDLFAPVSGEVVAVNTDLKDNPALVNQSPYEKGWMVRIRMASPAEIGTLLGAAPSGAPCWSASARRASRSCGTRFRRGSGSRGRCPWIRRSRNTRSPGASRSGAI